MEFKAHWIVGSLSLFLVGCGGLERHSYPANEANVLMVGTVELLQPYKGSASESNLSRAGWGALAAGIPGAFAGLADSDIGSFDAYSYLVATEGNKSHVVNSYSLVSLGDCVAVYESVQQGISSVEKRPLSECAE